MELHRKALLLGLAVTLLWGVSGLKAEETKAPASPATPAVAAPVAEIVQPTITLDRNKLEGGGTIKVTGKAAPGMPVYIEVTAADKKVRASRFDGDVDKDTGKRPYILYMTQDMPAFYKILVPKDKQSIIDKEKEKGGKWSYSGLLKDLGADIAYSSPSKIKVDHYQASFLASVIGSRGDQLPAMDEKDTKKRSMQLVKARFRSIGKVLVANVDVQPDGSYSATIKLDSGSAPGKYKAVAYVDKKVKAEASFENTINFPTVYLENAGTSMNLIYPFIITLAVAIFGVLMGAGGGFILNPILLSLFPALPHTIVAGTVTPTVLFSQASGILNYSKINFISWKLGTGIGLAMLAGGFIGPKLTEMITLDQFKSAFGVILIILAGLMLWQTMPGYLEKNKKEQAIMKEFKKRAEEAAKAK